MTVRRPAPADLVVDTSAVIAVLLDEPSGEALARALASAVGPLISAASVAEIGIVAEARAGMRGGDQVRDLLAAADVTVVPVDAAAVAGALDAWRRFGKGNHPVSLNYGDCFVYALAAHTELPLLCVGDDFAATDLQIVDLDRFVG